jgi:hypothetical protein
MPAVVRMLCFEEVDRSRHRLWCNSAEQAASERALQGAEASERLAVVIANHR